MLSAAKWDSWEAATTANVAVALTTLVMAAVTAWVAVETRRMARAARLEIEQGRRSTEAAEQAVAASREQLVELSRGRIDALGPVTALSAEPVAGAWLLLSRGPQPQDGGHHLQDPTGQRSSQVCEIGREFTLPRDGQQFLWFRTQCHFFNEGPTSVRLQVDGEVAEGDMRNPPNLAGYGQAFLVRPGKSLSFVWADGHTVEEWIDGLQDHDGIANPNRSLRLPLRVENLRRSVVDYLFVEVSGFPLEPVPQATGQWRLAQTALGGSAVYPTQRWYRHEGLPYPDTPWSVR